jgi:exodeoxyribonuclease-3
LSPPGPAPDRLRVATWNLNSLRRRLSGLERFLERVEPDVVCLQETKSANLSDAALEMFEQRGYFAAHVGSGAYNGVGVIARYPIDDVRSSGDFDDEHLDREPRLTTCLVRAPTPMRVVSMYVPHGRAVDHWHYEYKLAFLDALAGRTREWLREEAHVVVAGDINVAATDSDVFHPNAFVGSTHVTPLERAAVQRLLDAGLVDVDVARWGPRARRFTWWKIGFGYSRNLGMRLDMIAADQRLASRLDTTWIDHTERSTDSPSDHAAVIADFFLPDPDDARMCTSTRYERRRAVGADEKERDTADDVDEAVASATGESEADDNPVGHANIEKVDEILDEAGVNEGIAAGSRVTHPDEG